MKKRALLALPLALILALTACGNGGGEPAPEEEGTENQETTEEPAAEEKKSAEGMHIEVVAKGFQHQFWKSVNDGAQKAADEYGVTMNFQGPQNETAIQEQVQMLANAVNQKPDAIAFAALDTQASLDNLSQAKDMEIPVVGFDSGVPGAPEGYILATAATDNKAAAAMAADKMFEALKDKMGKASVDDPVRIGVVSQEVNSASLSDRTSGFIDRYVELSKDLDNVEDNQIAVIGNDKFENGVNPEEAAVIVDLAVPAKLTDAEGQTQAQTLLNKKDLIGIFGSNEFGAKAIINANNAVGKVLGKDKIIAVGFDSGALQIDAVKNETFIGSVTQNPVAIGYDAVELAVKAAQGEEVEDVDTGAVWYDSSNVDSEEVTPLLYE